MLCAFCLVHDNRFEGGRPEVEVAKGARMLKHQELSSVRKIEGNEYMLTTPLSIMLLLRPAVE